MPNHVANNVVITGPEDEIERLVRTCFRTHNGAPDGLVLDFHTLIPVDDIGMEADEVSLEAFKAREKAWGTKWIGYAAAILSRHPDYMEVSFTTAWDYPEPVYRELGNRFPALLFDIAATDPGNWAIVGCVAGKVAVFDRHADIREVFERVLKESCDSAMQPDT